MNKNRIEAYEYDRHVIVRVMGQFCHPYTNVVKCRSHCNIIHKESSHSSPIIPTYEPIWVLRTHWWWLDSAPVQLYGMYMVRIARTCIPNLCLDGFVIKSHTLRGEFHSNCWFCIRIKLVLCIAREDVGFPHPCVTNQDNYESSTTRNRSFAQIVVALFWFDCWHLNWSSFEQLDQIWNSRNRDYFWLSSLLNWNPFYAVY